MSGISSVAAFVHPPLHTSSRPVAQKSPDKEGDTGPGASDLRQAPAPATAGSVNLLV